MVQNDDFLTLIQLLLFLRVGEEEVGKSENSYLHFHGKTQTFSLLILVS